MSNTLTFGGQSYIECLITVKYFISTGLRLKSTYYWLLANALGAEMVANARRIETDFNGRTAPRGIHSSTVAIENEFGALEFARR